MAEFQFDPVNRPVLQCSENPPLPAIGQPNDNLPCIGVSQLGTGVDLEFSRNTAPAPGTMPNRRGR